MAARNRLPPWHELQHLPNGRDVLIRPIRPDDAQPLRAAFPLLEPGEVRMRMLSENGERSEEMADKMSRPDPRNEFAIVVAEPLPPGEAMVGAVARASIVPGGRDVEFSILVSRFIAVLPNEVGAADSGGVGRHCIGPRGGGAPVCRGAFGRPGGLPPRVGHERRGR